MDIILQIVGLVILVVVIVHLSRSTRDGELSNDDPEWLKYQEEVKKLVEKYGKVSQEEIILSDELDSYDKRTILEQAHRLQSDEIDDLLKTGERAKRKAKLGNVKRNIRRKAHELYGNIPVDDGREPISDEVKSFVWNRDGGKCVTCGRNEKIEFDHIVPFSRGGSNTARNLQILCETCNREKRDEI